MKRRLSRTTVIAAVTLLLVAVATPAQAADPDNLTPTANYNRVYCENQTLATSSIVCQTDNGAISVYMQSSVSAYLEGRIRDSLDNSYDPISSISVSYPNTPVYSGSGETDIIYQMGALSSPYVGMYWCNDAVDSDFYACDQGYVRITTSSGYHRRSLACHETGHAVGLLHGGSADPVVSNSDPRLGCMHTPFNADRYTLGSNNVAQINATY
ncbi:hypothetical protein [Microbacterium sp.]|uniref:hypothetical protein n=1 Tax=Microbacterium sp. TaxID=51671 RepID=UPI003736E9B4